MTGKFDNRINELYSTLVEYGTDKEAQADLKSTINTARSTVKGRGKMAKLAATAKELVGGKDPDKEISDAADEVDKKKQEVVVPFLKKQAKKIEDFGKSLKSQ